MKRSDILKRREIPECPECTAPMTLIFKKPKRGEHGQLYWIRKYKCDICGTEQTIYGNHLNDQPKQGE